MSTIAPTHVVLPLGNGMEYSMNIAKGFLELDLDSSYTFEVYFNGKTYTLLGTRVYKWDAATGSAQLYPAFVTSKDGGIPGLREIKV